MASEGKWTVSTDEENWPALDGWETREQAIAEGPEELGVEPGECFFVGQMRAPSISVPDADDFIDHILCQDDFCLECAEGSFDCTKEQRKELTNLLEKTFFEWMDRHGLRPRHFMIENSEKLICGE